MTLWSLLGLSWWVANAVWHSIVPSAHGWSFFSSQVKFWTENFFYRNEPKRDLFTISLRAACCLDCFSDGRKKNGLLERVTSWPAARESNAYVSFFCREKEDDWTAALWLAHLTQQGRTDPSQPHSTCTPSSRTCSKMWRLALNTHIGVSRTGGRQSYRVHYLTLMMECVSRSREDGWLCTFQCFGLSRICLA